MKQGKPNYRFHNPNPTVQTADYLLKILIESNIKKVQSAIEKAAAGTEKEKTSERHTA